MRILPFILTAFLAIFSNCQNAPTAPAAAESTAQELPIAEEESAAIEDAEVLSDGVEEAVVEEADDVEEIVEEAGATEEVNKNDQPELTAKGVDLPSTSSAKKAPIRKKKPKGKLDFESETHDYGFIMQGDSVVHRFKFKNIGKAPVSILNTKTSCGCTVPKHPEHPIAPGESADIKVVFSSTGKLGVQKPLITVVTNGHPSIYRLHLNGVVDADRAPDPEASKEEPKPGPPVRPEAEAANQ